MKLLQLKPKQAIETIRLLGKNRRVWPHESVTSMRPCRIRTNIASAKCTLHADGRRRFSNADDAIAPPNILQRHRHVWMLWHRFCRAMLYISAAYAVMRCLSVRLSVCPSVTFMTSAKETSNRIFRLFLRRVAPPFWFFRTKLDGNIPTGTPLTEVSNAREYEKFAIFDQHLALSRKWCEQSYSYYERRIGNRTKTFERYQFEWPWVKPYSTVSFRMTLSDLE